MSDTVQHNAQAAKPQSRLAQWGIEAAAIEMGWFEKQMRHHGRTVNGYACPLYHLNGTVQTHAHGQPILRWKNTDSNHPKNLWVGTKPKDCLPFYFAPDIETAIAKANGRVYLVEGEKDVLTMISAGYANTLTWTDGATSIPKNLGEVLQLLNVAQVIHLPDLDNAGRKSVQLLQAIFEPLPIAYKAVTLPATLGEKGDVNDWWRACGQDVRRFQAELEQHIQHSVMLEQAATPVIRLQTRPLLADRPHDDNLPDAFIHAIETALGVKSYRSSGFSHPVRCPFHEDDAPSAGWHREIHILKCFVCGTMLAKDVGAKLGIHLSDYSRGTRLVQSTQKDRTRAHASQPQEKPATPTDDEIGDAILKQWDGDTAFFYGKWQHYESGYWQVIERVDDTVWAAMKSHKGAGYKPSVARKTSIIDYLKARLLVDSIEGDNGLCYINLTNGLYHLETGALEPHRRDLYLTHQLAFAYDPDATCEVWLQFLAEALRDATLIAVLQEAFGYSLTPDTHLEKMFWLYGEAATGKSTILRVLHALLGSAATTVDLGALRKNPYQLVQIPGKRVIASSEAAAGSVLEDSLIKQLVSGEEIIAREIYGKNFHFTPQAKLWWVMNEIPTNLDRSSAIYRRLLLLPFRYPVAPDQRDTHLFERLEQELAGIFNWAVAGLQRLRANGTFTEAAIIEEAVHSYQYANDTEAVFLQDSEWVLLTEDATTLASDLYIAYKAWCEQNGHRYKSRTAVASDWNRLKLERERKTSGFFYHGIRLTPLSYNVVMAVKAKTGQDHPLLS